MFDIAPTELLIVALVALVVIGPKDLPNVLRTVGQWVGRARGMARHFRSGIDTMIREAELEEMEKKWAAENERIMREHPMLPSEGPMQPPVAHHGDQMMPLVDPAPELPPSAADLPPPAGDAERRDLP